MATVTLDGQDIDISGTELERALQRMRDQGNLTADGLSRVNRGAQQSSGFLDSLGTYAAGAGGALVDLGKSVYSGTATLSTGFTALARNMPGLAGSMSSVAEGIVKEGEAYLGTFRQLSQTGGGLNGDLFELKNSAAQARLTLDQFASITEKNAAALAAMGGTVNQGTRIFTQMSKEFFDGTNGLEGFAERLTNMGMTTEDINEQLALMGEIQQRQNLMDADVRRRSVESAVRLATEMDAMAKLTGKQKDALEEEMMASMRKGQVEAKFRKIEMEQGAEAAAAARASYAEAMVAAQKAGPDAVAALEETFVLGGVRSEQARRGIVALGGAADAAQATFRAIADTPLSANVGAMVNNMDAAIVQRIQSSEFLDTAMLASAGNQYGQAAATMLENAGQFETAISRFMQEGMSYADAVRAAREQVQAEQEGRRRPGEERTVGADAGRAIANAELRLKDLSAVINDQLLGDNGKIQAFANELRSLSDFMATGFNRQSIDDMVRPIIDEVARAAGVDPAPEGPEGPREASPEQAELERSATEIIRNIAETTELTREQQDRARLIMDSLLRDDESQQLLESMQEGANAMGLTLDEFIRKQIMESDTSSLAEDIAASVGKDAQAVERRVQSPITLDQMLEEMDNVNANTVILNADNVFTGDGFSTGTIGQMGSLIQDFGEGTMAMLHGQEGVITAQQLENMAAGVSNIMQNNVRAPQTNVDIGPLAQAVQELRNGMEQNISNMASSLASSDRGDVFDTLNTSLQELTNLSSQQLNQAQRQVKKLSGLGSDIFRGLG